MIRFLLLVLFFVPPITNAITINGTVSPITTTCEPGETRVYFYGSNADGYFNPLGVNLGTLNNGDDEYPTGQFNCDNTWYLPADVYDWQVCNVGDTFCTGASGNITVTTQLVNNITWGSPNGFWGDTTPGAIIGNMTASVQDTGDNVYPLLAFLGIPLGFAIAGFLMYQIKNTLTPIGEQKNDPHRMEREMQIFAKEKTRNARKRNKEPRL